VRGGRSAAAREISFGATEPEGHAHIAELGDGPAEESGGFLRTALTAPDTRQLYLAARPEGAHAEPIGQGLGLRDVPSGQLELCRRFLRRLASESRRCLGDEGHECGARPPAEGVDEPRAADAMLVVSH
jgi:hypothetical protein